MQPDVESRGDEFAAGLPPDLAIIVELMAEAMEASVNEFLRQLIETAHTERTLAKGDGTYDAAVVRLGVFLPGQTHAELLYEAREDRRSPAAQALVLIEEALAARRAG